MHSKTYLFSISSHPNAIHINSLSIDFLQPFIDFSQYDYFILTSKQASKALTYYKKDAYIDTKALCISKATAKSYKNIGGEVLGVGKGYGDKLYDIIIQYPKEIRWLYLRASIIASDFVEICKKEGYNISEVIVYESKCSDEILEVQVNEEDTLIFTSPSSVKCFLKKSVISKKNRVVVIGRSTAKALPVGIDFIVSAETTIQSCLETLES